MSRVLLLSLALLVFAAPASAEELTYRVGPIGVGPYQVRQSMELNIPKPQVDGNITAMSVDVVDKQGKPVPIRRLMLHHIVFLNLGDQVGAKHDATCDAITNWDSVSQIPALAERFYAAGEERATLHLPPGYGYAGKGRDTWGMLWMLMNHRAVSDQAYIQYKITYDTAQPLTPVRPVWMDVRDCKADPVYDVPGGGAPGSTDVQTTDWTAPEAGRVVAAAGHVHGGGESLTLSEPDCGGRVIGRSTPTWGLPSHPFYNVHPVLHEPGPIQMSAFSTATGYPIAAGQRLRLTSTYDAVRPHTRVMGIMVAYIAPGQPQDSGCATPPADVLTSAAPAGRSTPPVVTVPLTGLDRKGRAVTITRPPGRTTRLRSGTTVRVKNFAFSRRNLSVPAGSTVRWSFQDTELHDVTVASGPRGFSSPHHTAAATFSQKLTTPGTYRLFCSLHPVAMTERIVVRK